MICTPGVSSCQISPSIYTFSLRKATSSKLLWRCKILLFMQSSNSVENYILCFTKLEDNCNSKRKEVESELQNMAKQEVLRQRKYILRPNYLRQHFHCSSSYPSVYQFNTPKPPPTKIQTPSPQPSQDKLPSPLVRTQLFPHPQCQHPTSTPKHPPPSQSNPLDVSPSL